MDVLAPPFKNDIVSVLRRRSLAFAATFVIVYALVIVVLNVVPVRYSATGSILVADQTTSAEGGQPIGADKIGDPADLESQIQLVRAPRVLRLVSQRADVQAALTDECNDRGHGSLLGGSGSVASCLSGLKDAAALVEQLQQKYAVAAVGRSRVITVTYESTLPSVAQLMTNALVTTYLEDRHNLSAGQNQTTTLPIQHQLDELNKSIKEDEAKIRAFRSQNGLVRGSMAGIGAERLSGISQSLIAAEAAKADAAAKLAEVEKAAKTNLFDSPTVMGNHTIAELEQQLTLIEIEHARSSASLGPRHPAMISIDQARDALKARIALELQAVVNGARKTYETATALTVSLRQKMLSLQNDAIGADDQESSIEDLVRALDLKKGKYADLAKEITRLETQAPTLADTTRLVSLAELPTTPYFPKKMPFLVGGLVLALLVACGVALGLDRMDHRPRTSADIGGRSSVPVLAEIPYLKMSTFQRLRAGRQGSPQAQVLQRAAQDRRFQAGIAQIAGALLSGSQAGRGVKSLALVSPASGDGRTIMTTALAYQLAASGKRTLVVECNFNRPRMAEMFRLGRSPGLTGLLQSNMPIEAAVVPTASPTLFLLPAGQAGKGSGSLLGSSRMAEFIEWSKRFDFVLFDTAAHASGPESTYVARMVDAVLCCVRSGHTNDRQMISLMRDLHGVGVEPFGMIMTMSDVAVASGLESHQVMPRPSSQAGPAGVPA